MVTVDRWLVNIWVDSLYQKEMVEIFTDLLNGDYIIENLKKDFRQWLDENMELQDIKTIYDT